MTKSIRIGSSGGSLTGESAQHGRSTIRRLFTYARPYTAQLIVVSLLVLISTSSALAGPILLGRAIDESIIPGDFEGLARTALIMLVIYVIGGFAAAGHGIIMVDVAQRVVANLRADLFTHLQALSMAYHDQHPTGDLMSRVTNDTEAINRVLSNGLIQFITNLLQLAGIMVAMFLLNWRLAIGTLILLPLMLLITTIVTRRSRVAFREVQFNLGALNAISEENIAGIRVVQAFARAEETKAQFAEVNAANRRSGVKANIITASCSQP